MEKTMSARMGELRMALVEFFGDATAAVIYGHTDQAVVALAVRALVGDMVDKRAERPQ